MGQSDVAIREGGQGDGGTKFELSALKKQSIGF